MLVLLLTWEGMPQSPRPVSMVGSCCVMAENSGWVLSEVVEFSLKESPLRARQRGQTSSSISASILAERLPEPMGPL